MGVGHYAAPRDPHGRQCLDGGLAASLGPRVATARVHPRMAVARSDRQQSRVRRLRLATPGAAIRIGVGMGRVEKLDEDDLVGGALGSACGRLRTRWTTIVLSSNLRSQRRASKAGTSRDSPVTARRTRAPRAPEPPACPTKAPGTAHGRQRHRRPRPSQKGGSPGQPSRRIECNGQAERRGSDR
jgi:hypothetical protein